MSLKKTRHFRNFLSQSNLLLPTLPSACKPTLWFPVPPTPFHTLRTILSPFLFSPSPFVLPAPLLLWIHLSSHFCYFHISFTRKQNKKKSTKKFPLQNEKGNNPENQTSVKPINNPATAPSSTDLYATLDSYLLPFHLFRL